VTETYSGAFAGRYTLADVAVTVVALPIAIWQAVFAATRIL
jgi:hypothetical protein